MIWALIAGVTVHFAAKIMGETKLGGNLFATTTYGEFWKELANAPYSYPPPTQEVENTGFYWKDNAVLDAIHCWSVFTMYWPMLPLLAIMGQYLTETWQRGYNAKLARLAAMEPNADKKVV